MLSTVGVRLDSAKILPKTMTRSSEIFLECLLCDTGFAWLKSLGAPTDLTSDERKYSSSAGSAHLFTLEAWLTVI